MHNLAPPLARILSLSPSLSPPRHVDRLYKIAWQYLLSCHVPPFIKTCPSLLFYNPFLLHGQCTPEFQLKRLIRRWRQRVAAKHGNHSFSWVFLSPAFVPIVYMRVLLLMLKLRCIDCNHRATRFQYHRSEVSPGKGFVLDAATADMCRSVVKTMGVFSMKLWL